VTAEDLSRPAPKTRDVDADTKALMDVGTAAVAWLKLRDTGTLARRVKAETALARKLAAAEGEFREIGLHDLERDFQNWMETQIKTAIVEGFPTRPAALERAKQYVTADQIEVNRKMRPVEMMPAPNFIFCTSDAEPLKHLSGRRFHIVRMGAAG
jgi:hypothetical protein